MTGKERCEFLRNVRMNIAEMNNISFTPHECDNEDWCPGYCPLCDEESSMLMRQLEHLEASGCRIKIDVESIKALEQMSHEPYSDEPEDEDYFNDENMRTAGTCPVPPEYIRKIELCEEWKGKGVFDEDYLDKLVDVCDGCYRVNSIVVDSGKPVSCACLSEHFFERVMKQGLCRLKKESEDAMSDLDLYKEAKNNNISEQEDCFLGG